MSDEYADESKRPIVACPRCNSRSVTTNYRMPGVMSVHCQNCRHNFDWQEPHIPSPREPTDETLRIVNQLDKLVRSQPNLKPTIRLSPMGTSPKAVECAEFCADTLKKMGFVVLMKPETKPETKPEPDPKPDKCPKCGSKRIGLRGQKSRCFHCNHQWEPKSKMICPKCQSDNVGCDQNSKYMRCFRCGNAWKIEPREQEPSEPPKPDPWKAKLESTWGGPADPKRQQHPIGPPFFDDPKNYVLQEPTAEQLKQAFPNVEQVPMEQSDKLFVDFGDGRKIQLNPAQVKMMRDQNNMRPIPLTREQTEALENSRKTEPKPTEPDLERMVFAKFLRMLIDQTRMYQQFQNDHQYGFLDTETYAQTIRAHQHAQRRLLETIEANRKHLKSTEPTVPVPEFCPYCRCTNIEHLYTLHTELREGYRCQSCTGRFDMRPNGDTMKIVEPAEPESKPEPKSKPIDRSRRDCHADRCHAPECYETHPPQDCIYDDSAYEPSSGLGRFQEPPTAENRPIVDKAPSMPATPSEPTDDESSQPSSAGG